MSWSGATNAGDVVISLLPLKLLEQKPAEGKSILCTVPDSGSFQVPAEALSHLPAQQLLAVTHTALTIVRPVSDTFQVEGTSITVNATSTQTRIGIVE